MASKTLKEMVYSVHVYRNSEKPELDFTLEDLYFTTYSYVLQNENIITDFLKSKIKSVLELLHNKIVIDKMGIDTEYLITEILNKLDTFVTIDNHIFAEAFKENEYNDVMKRHINYCQEHNFIENIECLLVAIKILM